MRDLMQDARDAIAAIHEDESVSRDVRGRRLRDLRDDIERILHITGAFAPMHARREKE